MTSPEFNSENFNSNDFETLQLRDELVELFKTHANIVAIPMPSGYLPEGYSQPTYAILGGTYKNAEDTENPEKTQIWQRYDGKEIEYLIISQNKNTYHWYRISDNKAYEMFLSHDAPFTSETSKYVRWCIRDESFDYTAEKSMEIASGFNRFEQAEDIVNKRQNATEDPTH